MNLMPSHLPSRLWSLARNASLLVFTVFTLLDTIDLQAQFGPIQEDVSIADGLARKYKDEDVACLSSHLYFTFDKGKNALNDKVVVIQEETETDFIALK
ncbi:MAG: hypothetical protein KGO82_15160, partial [Bacteroidota bacterium]|nr:hypothetical protein [Bacteroidota bacterium]